MASNIPVDDDEEFDWEAAVRQIDEACAKPSTSGVNNSNSDFVLPPLVNGFSSEAGKKPGAASRQSTLDRFMGKVAPRKPSSKNHQKINDRDPECIVDEGSGGAPGVDIDSEAAKTWIFPVNIPLRDYQFAITKTALFSNTLVALPTGLGKTLIAAVVMYNYFRWFPDGKIVFAAPSRPLVMQQIEACHNIVGIPQEWTIDMTGQVSPTRRAGFWKSKRVFFVTPQVLEKDIQSGTCLVKYLVCLVIDEAHRAMGNYSYSVAVRELMAIPVHLRILALTATPGSKHQSIQQIIDNLQISTLEYRDENDHDVIPYVHNRKVELIEVALGKDAVEINKKILEVIHPYVAKLSAMGVLQNRDYQTLTPIDLLNSRDKFRQAPPSELPHYRHGEAEGYFGVLITLYHIRKLLSSHGIRPAYEMLEDKLQQGSFLRMMSKNEDIMNAKLLMQRNLSHGAPSPKLSKMLEVLVDHFKTKDPRNSRVIIFSNFRGSVRDIMNALASIGDLVKATEFIGQSSGKTLKGQSQKVQQAVLEKFRAGGYNVIVATSIGEEGLDIMEVDLVICFDANVSPLRMIQRMGRTGRKHDGRVVVLACEGSELKGYMRKQANNRSIKKLMQNGGMNSFNFHASSRMIPHIFKPEVQFVELSIEQFVPRGKKPKDDNTVQSPPVTEKLTPGEMDLIAKYFHHTTENAWKPSLITFPNFQAFPSKVHRVMHSSRTGMLIDSMQAVQGLTFMGNSKTFKDVVSSMDRFKFDDVMELDGAVKDSQLSDSVQVAKSPEREVIDVEESPVKSLRTKEPHSVPSSHRERPPAHSYLFSSDLVSVDSNGNVMVSAVPPLNLKHTTLCERLRSSLKVLDEQAKSDANLATFEKSCTKDDTLSTRTFHVFDSQKEKMLEEAEIISETPIKRSQSNGRDSDPETPDAEETEVSSPLADKDVDDFGDAELSPRLTNMIKTGIVPESPVDESGLLKCQENESRTPDITLPANSHAELPLNSVEDERNIRDNDDNTCIRTNNICSTIDDMKSPLHKMKGTRLFSCSPADEAQSPLGNPKDNSNSKSWHLSSGEKSINEKQEKKFKRLRKVGDLPVKNLARSLSGASPRQINHGRKNLDRASGKRKLGDDVRTFIDEEAEVSSDTEVSGDEDVDTDVSQNDSFIDDRINLTCASTQAESGRIDMLAIYRRSLLSQSPMAARQNSSVFSPDSVHTIEGSSGKTSSSLKTPQTDSIDDEHTKTNSHTSQNNQTNFISDTFPTRNNNARETETRKRKSSIFETSPLPAINLDREFSHECEPGGIAKESFQAFHPRDSETVFANEVEDEDDDKFFASIDFDALEAQATSLLRNNKPESSRQDREMVSPSDSHNLGGQGSPSFDLGF